MSHNTQPFSFIARFGPTTLAAAFQLIPNSAHAAPCGSSNQARCSTLSSPFLDTNVFANEIADGIERELPSLMGYALTVVDRDGRDIVIVSSGKAVAGSDGNSPFYSTTVSNIGSVSKVLTEAAIVHAVEMAESAPGKASCNITLDTPFLDVLPSVFRETDGDDFYEGVTIRQILNHQGGVPIGLRADPYGRPFDYWVMMTRVPTLGLTLCPKGVSCYSNDNYVLATTMLPFIDSCESIDFLLQLYDDDLNVHCQQVSTRARQSCQLDRAFTLLGAHANEVVKDYIIDPAGATASCWAHDITEQGRTVALQYASETSATGFAVPVDYGYPRGCGVGHWFISSADLAQVLRYIKQGSFFFEAASRSEIPEAHNGALPPHYAALTQSLDGDLNFAFLTNSGPLNTQIISDIVEDAHDAARTNISGFTSSTALTSMRGAWDCEMNGTGIDMRLQIYGSNDVRAYHLADFNGHSSKEIWRHTSNGTSTASGTYVYYEGDESPLGPNPTFQGTWSLIRHSATSASVTRVDNNTGWTGAYTCSKGAE